MKKNPTWKLPIQPKSPNQQAYLESIQTKTITICTGPAGVGKTHLACVAAIHLLEQKEIDRIILCRPAIESGENLGYLPGDINEKMDPYLQPFFDSFGELIGTEKIERYTRQKKLDVIPLAYMKGRTFKQAFVILDEAQNVTKPGLKTFLTRLGKGSKIVINGDPDQIDLEAGLSGLEDCADRLHKLRQVGVIDMDEHDIVRHPLVKKILEAYEDV